MYQGEVVKTRPVWPVGENYHDVGVTGGGSPVGLAVVFTQKEVDIVFVRQRIVKSG
jgi:hypothetical protein